MSTSLNAAIFARWTGVEVLSGAGATAQSDLAALLTTDINTGNPIAGRAVADGVYLGNKDDAPDGYPMVTFRASPGTIDRRFEDGGLAVDLPLLDVEIWDNSRSGTLATDIEDAIDRLTDMRRGAPVLPLAQGVCYYLRTFTTSALFYDQSLKAWCLAKRFQIIEGK